MRLKRRERFFLFTNQFFGYMNLILYLLYAVYFFFIALSLSFNIETMFSASVILFIGLPFWLFYTWLTWKWVLICNDFQRYYHNYRKLATILELEPTKDYEMSELKEILNKK